MKVPVRWLSEFIELEEEAEKVAEILTFGGLEVEEVYDHYQTLGEIIAVKVLEVNKPSELKDLAVCTVHDGKDSFTVLTAAVDLVKPGQVLALARPGSKTFFWDKIEVKEVKGYKSWGMFLSPYEAGVSEEKDILLELPHDVKPGGNIYKALNISETILDVSITPNRGDCLSVLGLARELSLLTGLPLKEVKFGENLKEGAQPKGSIEILDPDGCFRYVGRWFSGVKVAPSPFFIVQRLVFCGLRPINNLVDITNYVLLELGQPLHAFDWKRVAGGRIIVRRAKEGERLLFLDGVERELSSEDLVIADAEKALVLAGIMGGEESGVSDNTQEVFLESAWFNAKRVRLSGMRHRLTTESSYRFERKVDPEGVYLAMLRATELIFRYANPEEVSIIVDEYPVRFAPPRIELKKKRLSAYLGFEIPEEKVKGILNKLGDLEVTPESFILVPKSYRQDLSIPEDLIEEVARVYGYDKVPTTYPEGVLYCEHPLKTLELTQKIRRLLAGFGFFEAITYSFIDPKLIEHLNYSPEDPRRDPIKLENPISAEMSVLRTTLVPGLLQTAFFNQAREVESLKLFEVGKVFFKAEELASERLNLGLLLAGWKSLPSWYEEERSFDLYDIKGVVSALGEALRVDFLFKPYSEEPFLKRGFSFDLYLGEEKVGYLGRLKSLIAKDLDLREPVFVAEIYLDKLLSFIQGERALSVKKPPKFPSTFRDVSLVVKKGIPFGTLLTYLEAKEIPFLEDIKLIAAYEGKPLDPDERSLTLRLWFRAEDRTLRVEEVDPIISQLVEELIEKFQIRLR